MMSLDYTAIVLALINDGERMGDLLAGPPQAQSGGGRPEGGQPPEGPGPE